jgi:hypothetical protein
MAKATAKAVRKPRSPDTDTRATTARRITEVLAQVEKQLSKSEFKASVADYIRLLQMQKEYERDTPRDIEVTWVEAQNENELSAA